ncbi:aldehyde dehydrogenase EutE [Candidatus Sumerlaeota bacterium]|nr:aldehyde dehydrogenase EutE [Candidatus Sumerlaeota bacterium]
MALSDTQIRSIVETVVERLTSGKTPVSAPSPAPAPVPASPTGELMGVFDDMDEAIQAAADAFHTHQRISLAKRRQFIEKLRQLGLQYAEDFAIRTMRETGMGRVDHKIAKFQLVAAATPGPEIIEPRAFTGDHGLTTLEYAPYGTIGAVTPSTHPVPTLLNNLISILSAGNTVVFNAHPASKDVFAYAVDLFSRGLATVGAPPNLFTTVRVPTIESATTMFNHPRVRVLLVTGGPGVVRAALGTPKKAICAGPGNPPVVVDETADLVKAARDIVIGASFDNNIVCIGEKEVFVVERMADGLIREMLKNRCVLLTRDQIDALAVKAFQFEGGVGCGSPNLNRDFVGRNASVLAEAIGLRVPEETLLLIGETDNDHAFVQEEQMMPFLPIVRCRDFDEALERAYAAEHGFGHTATIFSRNIEHMHRMAVKMNVSIFVKNGPTLAGLGSGGEGYTSFSIASPTGEGCTTARTFTRERRCALIDYFRIV